MYKAAGRAHIIPLEKSKTGKTGLSDDAEVQLLPDDLRQFSGYVWQLLAIPGYFLATV